MAVFGVWMWNQNVQTYGAQKIAERCARLGVTDLFFLTKGLAGTTAFHSVYAPHTSERDLLAELTEAAHRHGMRVHAWFTSACDEHYKKLHPESGRCHYSRGKDRELISLADEGYLSYMEKIVREVSRNYDIDGLHLDYIRYNHLLYGWAEEDMARYTANGANAAHLRSLMDRMFCAESKEENLLFDALRSGDESVMALARTRRQDVVRFASTLTNAARSENSRLLLSAALMPEGAYEDTAFADLHYGQVYEDAAALYDYGLPMAYSKAYGQDAQWVKQVAEGSVKRGLKTIMGLHAYEGGSGPQLLQDLTALEHTPVEGVCLFREGAFVMTYTQGKELTVWNALDREINGVHAAGGTETAVLNETIAPGEERRWTLPFEAERIRIFAGEKEQSVFLSSRR